MEVFFSGCFGAFSSRRGGGVEVWWAVELIGDWLKLAMVALQAES